MEELFECTFVFGKQRRGNPMKWVSGVEFDGDQVVIKFSPDQTALPHTEAYAAFRFLSAFGSKVSGGCMVSFGVSSLPSKEVPDQ